MATFTIRQVIEHEVEEGWGAWFSPIYSGDEYDDRIEDLDGGVVEITADTVREIGGAICVMVQPKCGIPVDLFSRDVEDAYGDQHDLRDRLFATRAEAEDHLRYTLERWANPMPWESFVRL